MAVIIETVAAEDLDLGTASVLKTHPTGGQIGATQISLSTFARSYQDTTTTWAPGEIVTGSQASTTVSVAGATAGDKVLVSLTTLTTDALILTGHVSASGQVTVVLANLTGASVTISSGTLSVLVFAHR